VVVVSVVMQPERIKPVSAARLRAIEYVFIILNTGWFGLSVGFLRKRSGSVSALSQKGEQSSVLKWHCKTLLPLHGDGGAGRYLSSMKTSLKTKLIAFTFLALGAAFFAGCTATTETATTPRTREQSSMYAR
jgi:hypothetical protein